MPIHQASVPPVGMIAQVGPEIDIRPFSESENVALVFWP